MGFPKWAFPAIFAAGMVAAGGCTQKMHSNQTSSNPLSEKDRKIMQAQNQFAFKIFDLVTMSAAGTENLMISPLSIYTDLSMAYNGAAGATKKAMQEALQLSGSEIQALNWANNTMLRHLPASDTSITVDIANAIWYDQALEPLSSFLSVNKKYYQAAVQPADFNDPQTVKQINQWVAGQTHKKIESILDQISPDDKMYLLNAVYFNGEWTNSFDPKLTNDRTFHTTSQTQLQVPFMSKEARFNYLENDSLQMVELPYGNGSFSMYVLLPAKGIRAEALVAALNPTTFSSLLAGLDSAKIQLYLPKWEAAYSIEDLAPELSRMGMGVAFGPNADFTKMYENGQVAISKVTHKTYIKVDEKGTEAAAVTSIGIRLTAARPGFPPVMEVNRPFVYIITAKNSGSILFMGVVQQPA